MLQYKLLGKTGLRVSQLCLGTMTFGTEWGNGADKKTSEQIFHSFLDKGGNFIDTANRYTETTSELYLGEFIKNSKQREALVVASKYGLFTQKGIINDGGNHRKNLVQSVEATLQRLQVEYLDLLYLHAWDFTTSVQEVLRALDDLVRAGKVLHLKISDTPAWIVAQANTMADLKNFTPFSALQIEYSLVTRDAERELIPMADAFDMAILAWAPLGAGILTGKYNKANTEQTRLKEGSKKLTTHNLQIAQALVDLAKQINQTPAAVAIAWILHKGYDFFPIIGARTLEQFEQCLQALDCHLSEEQLAYLDQHSAITYGFPHDFLASAAVDEVLFGGLKSRILKRK